MSLRALRPLTRALRASPTTKRAHPRLQQPHLQPQPRFLSQSHRLCADQGYGDGKGDPAGENPQAQGASESEHLEHPGPAPPKVAEGKDASPNTGKSSSGGESEGEGGGGDGGKKASKISLDVMDSDEKLARDNSKDSSSSSSSSSGKSGGGGQEQKQPDQPAKEDRKVKGAEPKILNTDPPPADANEEVKEHNDDIDRRAERLGVNVRNSEPLDDKDAK